MPKEPFNLTDKQGLPLIQNVKVSAMEKKAKPKTTLHSKEDPCADTDCSSANEASGSDESSELSESTLLFALAFTGLGAAAQGARGGEDGTASNQAMPTPKPDTNKPDTNKPDSTPAPAPKPDPKPDPTPPPNTKPDDTPEPHGDTQAPGIVSIQYLRATYHALSSDNPYADPDLAAGDNAWLLHAQDELFFSVKLTENVYVKGSPVLMLDIGGQERFANFDSGSGTNELRFKYTVQRRDHDLDGISIPKNALVRTDPKEDDIVDGAGNPLQGFESGDRGDSAPVEFNSPGQTLRISAAGLAAIDLGDIGQLISPVRVEGKWYYLLDRNRNGELDEGDALRFSELAAYLNTNQATARQPHWLATGDRYQYPGQVKVMLPETTFGMTAVYTTKPPADTQGQGTGEASLQTDSNRLYLDHWEPGPIAGTAVNSPLMKNPQYDGLAAIWDAFNGDGTGSRANSDTAPELSGIPSAWKYPVLENKGKIWGTSSYIMPSTFTLARGMGQEASADEFAYGVFQVI